MFSWFCNFFIFIVFKGVIVHEGVGPLKSRLQPTGGGSIIMSEYASGVLNLVEFCKEYYLQTCHLSVMPSRGAGRKKEEEDSDQVLSWFKSHASNHSPALPERLNTQVAWWK